MTDDTIKRLSFSPAAEGIGNAVISPEEWGKGEYFTLIGAGAIDRQNEIAAKIVERFNAGAGIAAPNEAIAKMVEAWHREFFEIWIDDWKLGELQRRIATLFQEQQRGVPKGPAGDRGQVGWMGGEWDK